MFLQIQVIVFFLHFAEVYVLDNYNRIVFVSVKSDTGVERMPNHPLLLDDGPLRDLSAWRVSIPEIVARPDPDNQRKTIYMFNIEVRRVDVLESESGLLWIRCLSCLLWFPLLAAMLFVFQLISL